MKWRHIVHNDETEPNLCVEHGTTGWIQIRQSIHLDDGRDHVLSPLPAHVEQWIQQIRFDPMYSDLPYKPVSLIITDEAGEWSRRSAKWIAVNLRVTNLDVHYVTPETSKEAGHAEKTNCILEEAIKAILMEQNLPPDH